MKKTLLSVLAGFIVAGSAVALPTPEDVKKLCYKHPDKYVWVEKTQACIDINPCQSNNLDVKNTYCAQPFWIADFLDKETVMYRYVNKVLNTSIESFRNGDDFIGVLTNDGGYFAVEIKKTFGSRFDKRYYGTMAALWAYDHYFERVHDDLRNTDQVAEVTVLNEKECQDIVDFASLLADEFIEYEFYSPSKISNICRLFIKLPE